MSNKGGGLMISALLLSLETLSFILFCHCNLWSASPSLFLPSRSLCVPYNIKLFKMWHPFFVLSKQATQGPAQCLQHSSKGRGREGPFAVCGPSWATTISPLSRSCKTCGLHSPASMLQLIYSLGFEDHKKAEVTTQRSKWQKPTE